MKSRVLSIACLLFVSIATVAHGSVLFDASPGSGVASASFGVEKGNLIPYVGLDIVWLSFNISTSDSDFDMYQSGGSIRRYESIDKTELDFGANLVIPHFGMKLYLSRNNDVKTFLNGKMFFSIPFVKTTGSETHTSYYWEDYNPGDIPDDSNVYVDEYEMNDDIAKDVLSFAGLSIGYGVEYSFSDHFGIGSEFGLQMIYNSFEASDSNESSWSGGSYGDKWSTELQGALRVTYVKLHFVYRL